MREGVKMKRFSIVVLLLFVSFSLILAGGCSKTEKEFPSKQIKLICPPAPGGTSDFVTRSLSHYAKDAFGNAPIVENKPGGAGAVGMSFGANAKPDGYTVTYVVVEIAILPHRGLTPISYKNFDLLFRINYTPAALTVSADAPYKTLKEFVDYAKANPGELKAGNSGAFSIWHLASVQLEQSIDASFIHIPHKGAAPAVKSLLGGHVDLVTVAPTEVQTNVEAGRLRMLAVFGDGRDPNFPDVPTAEEEGFDIRVGAWGGLGVPVGTPEDVKTKLIEGFKQSFGNEEFQKMMRERSVTLAWIEGVEFENFVKSQSDMFGGIIAKLEMK